MADYTIAQLRTAGIQPASTDPVALPGFMVFDYEFDGTKRSTAATDTIAMFEIPALAGMIVHAAALTVVRAGTASATADIQLNTTDVTGLTAWQLDATAGTKLVKLATAANTIINTGSATTMRLQINTAGVGAGKFRVRVWATLLASPSGTPV